MKRQNIGKFKTMLPDKAAFTIETEDDFPKLNALVVVSGKRGGGKSVAVSNFLKRCKDKHYCDLALLVTPTYNSNKNIWNIAEIEPGDVYEPDMVAMKNIVKRIEAEKKEWEDFCEKKARYEEFKKDRVGSIESIPAVRLLKYYSDGFLEPEFEEPVWKYPVEQPPRVHVVIDDCMGTDLMAKRTAGLLNFAIKHRHIADGLGCSLYMLVQSYKAQGGVNRAIRENTTMLWQFPVHSEQQIESIREECDLPITEEEWQDMCNYTFAIPFTPLIIDFSPKCNTKRFRAGMDQYIYPPSLKCECKNKK